MRTGVRVAFVIGVVVVLGSGRSAAAQAVAARLRTVAPPMDFDTPVARPKPAPKPVAPAKPAATSPVATAKPAASPVAPAKPAASPVATAKPTASPVATAKPAASPVATGKPAASPASATASGTAPAPTGGAPSPASAAAAAKPGAKAAPARPTAEAAPAVAAVAPARPPGALSVKGLTGTLNTDDVHQTMEAQKAAFNACIEQGRRSVRWVHGAMRFAFKVDADGKVLDARPVQSDVGHRELEQCLTNAVSAVVFPKPAGRARAQFAWAVTVEPAGTPADPLDAKSIAKLLRKQRRVIARSCELRPRERFQLTAYVAQTGKVLSAGGFALRRGAEKVDCVVEAVGELHLPKVTRRSKVSFRL